MNGDRSGTVLLPQMLFFGFSFWDFFFFAFSGYKYFGKTGRAREQTSGSTGRLASDYWIPCATVIFLSTVEHGLTPLHWRRKRDIVTVGIARNSRTPTLVLAHTPRASLIRRFIREFLIYHAYTSRLYAPLNDANLLALSALSSTLCFPLCSMLPRDSPSHVFNYSTNYSACSRIGWSDHRDYTRSFFLFDIIALSLGGSFRKHTFTLSFF